MPKRTSPPLFRSIDQSSTQRIAFDVPANNEEVFVVLNRKALVPLLINVIHSASMIVCMIAQRMSASNPAHEPTHLAINHDAARAGARRMPKSKACEKTSRPKRAPSTFRLL
jgi:hypothetical protein